MKIDEETRARIDKLPIVSRMIANYLLDMVENLATNKCDEETLISAASTMNNNAKGRIGKEDVLNYDKAGNILGFGCTNRVARKRLLDKHGIKQVKINNMSCGFRRDEIMALRDKLNEDIRKRENKRKKGAK